MWGSSRGAHSPIYCPMISPESRNPFLFKSRGLNISGNSRKADAGIFLPPLLKHLLQSCTVVDAGQRVGKPIFRERIQPVFMTENRQHRFVHRVAKAMAQVQ